MEVGPYVPNPNLLAITNANARPSKISKPHFCKMFNQKNVFIQDKTMIISLPAVIGNLNCRGGASFYCSLSADYGFLFEKW